MVRSQSRPNTLPIKSRPRTTTPVRARLLCTAHRVSEVTRDMQIAAEEVFGPVLSIQPYDTVDEAVEIANATVYGLGA